MKKPQILKSILKKTTKQTTSADCEHPHQHQQQHQHQHHPKKQIPSLFVDEDHPIGASLLPSPTPSSSTQQQQQQQRDDSGAKTPVTTNTIESKAETAATQATDTSGATATTSRIKAIYTESLQQKQHQQHVGTPPTTPTKHTTQAVSTPPTASTVTMTPLPKSTMPTPITPQRAIFDEDDILSTSTESESHTTTTDEDDDDGLNALPVETFLHNFRQNGAEMISTAYLMQKEIRQNTVTGTLTTSLPEDLFTIVDAQLSLLHEYLVSSTSTTTKQNDEVLMDGMLSIFRTLWYKQTHYRNSTFLQSGISMEECIAASNDFLRMTHRVDAVLQQCHLQYPHLAWYDHDVAGNNNHNQPTDQASMSVLRQEANDLIALYGSDAIVAAQKVTTFVMKKIEHESSIPQELFSKEWEDTWTQNQVVVSMIRTYGDFLGDIIQNHWYEHSFLLDQTILALVQCTTCFYIKYMIRKADQFRQQRRRQRRQRRFGKGRRNNNNNNDDNDSSTTSAFLNASRAVTRIMYDIEVLRDYFGSITRSSPTLARAVNNELSILSVILECLWLAVGGIDDTDDNDDGDSTNNRINNNNGYNSSLEEFIVVIHKRTGCNTHVTEKFLSDLWLLTCHEGNGSDAERHFQIITKSVHQMQSELTMVTNRLQERETNIGSPWKVSTASSSSSSSSNGRIYDTIQDFMYGHYHGLTNGTNNKTTTTTNNNSNNTNTYQTQASNGSCGNTMIAFMNHTSSCHKSSNTSKSTKNPLSGIDLSRKGTKELFARVQEFQLNLFRKSSMK